MRSGAPLGKTRRTYQLTIARWINAVDLRTLGGVANSLQDRSLACVCFSNNEDSELDVWDLGKILLCIHSTKVAIRRTGQGEFAGDCGEKQSLYMLGLRRSADPRNVHGHGASDSDTALASN